MGFAFKNNAIMMKKYFLLLLATILLTGVHGQNRSVDLPKNIPLQDILKKAKKQKNWQDAKKKRVNNS